MNKFNGNHSLFSVKIEQEHKREKLINELSLMNSVAGNSRNKLEQSFRKACNLKNDENIDFIATGSLFTNKETSPVKTSHNLNHRKKFSIGYIDSPVTKFEKRWSYYDSNIPK